MGLVKAAAAICWEAVAERCRAAAAAEVQLSAAAAAAAAVTEEEEEIARGSLVTGLGECGEGRGGCCCCCCCPPPPLGDAPIEAAARPFRWAEAAVAVREEEEAETETVTKTEMWAFSDKSYECNKLPLSSAACCCCCCCCCCPRMSPPFISEAAVGDPSEAEANLAVEDEEESW